MIANNAPRFLIIFLAMTVSFCNNTTTGDFLDARFITAVSPVVISPRLRTVQINSSLTLAATGGVAPYKFEISNGAGNIDSSTGYFTASGAAGTTVVSAIDSKGNRDFSILTIAKNATTIYYEDFQSGSYDTSKWNIGGTPSVISNTLRMNQNDNLRYGSVLGIGKAVTIEIDMDNINGAAGGTFCTPNLLIKNPTGTIFGYNGATEYIHALVDETGTFRIPSTVSGNFSNFAELRNGRIKIRFEWTAAQLRISKSDYEQVGAPMNLVRSVYWPGQVFNGVTPNFYNGFKFEFFNNVACENGGRIYSIHIFEP